MEKNFFLIRFNEIVLLRRSKMPRVYLNERQKLCHRLATWVQGEKKRLNLSDTDLAEEYGISQQAMSRKLRLEQFSFSDYLFFVQKFQPDNATLLYIVGL